MRWHNVFILPAFALAAAGLVGPGCTPPGAPPAGLAALPRETSAPADGRVLTPADAAQVKQVILRGDKPVLVFFYKGGCSSCMPVDPLMATLAGEYRGRATVAKFMLMTGSGAVTSPELKDKYGVSFYPAVILFVNGQETRRFMVDYTLNHYRTGLNEALGGALTRKD